MADLPIGSDDGAQQVEVIQTSTTNKLAIDSSGNITVNQGAAAVDANSWPIEMVDAGGVNVAAVDTDGSQFVKPVPVGTQGNAWNAASVSSGGNSSVVDCQYARTVAIFGNVSANVNPLRIQASQNNSNFYTIATINAASGDFGTTIDWGAKYLRLQSGQGGTAVTITATIAGK